MSLWTIKAQSMDYKSYESMDYKIVQSTEYNGACKSTGWHVSKPKSVEDYKRGACKSR